MHSGPIFLTGFMGCGKSTLGTALARLYGDIADFSDLDDIISSEAGMSIPEIFATHGEEGFRRMESECLRRIAAESGGSGRRLVVACGGGTPCREENIAIMSEGGCMVFLEAPVEVLVRRLMEAPAGQRPLLDGLKGEAEVRKFVEERLAARMPYYSRATRRFDSSRLEDSGQIEATAKEFYDTFLRECDNPTDKTN